MSQLGDDLRALGWRAPVRAVYETSKRAGVHGALLGRLGRNLPASAARPRPVLPVRTPDGPVRDRTLRAAAELADGRVTLFGRAFELGAVPDWHATLDSDRRWPRQPWWTIDIRSPRRAGDVKWTWELARHRHLVVLARASHLDPDDDRWPTTLERWLRSWLDDNPPEIGVHWASNLELALRAIAWDQVLGLAGDRLAPSTRADLGRHLWHAALHMLAELPYTWSTTQNNHLLGDALGLELIGAMFDHPTARRWQEVGRRVFRWQQRRQFRADGSSIDDALSYQRFVMEMLIVHALIDTGTDDEDLRTLRAAVDFLVRLGVGRSSVPQFGDWDEGRVLTSTGDPADLRGSLAAATACAGRVDLLLDGAKSEQADEVAWYLADPGSGEAGEPAAEGRSTDDRSVGAGIVAVSRHDLQVWLRSGERRWHGHADITAVDIAVADEWLVGDPGTGTYNGSLTVRNGLRASAAHSVTRIGGIDQLEPSRVFRWKHRAVGGLGHTLTAGQHHVMWGWHDAYRRIDPSLVVVRVVVVSPGGVAVCDWHGGPPGWRLPWDLTLPLGPSISAEPRAGGYDLAHAPGTHHLTLPGAAELRRACTAPWSGWWSPTYGSLDPDTWIEASGDRWPVVWSVALDGHDHSAAERDAVLWVEVDDAPPLQVSLEWLGNLARLRLREGESTWMVAAATGR